MSRLALKQSVPVMICLHTKSSEPLVLDTSWRPKVHIRDSSRAHISPESWDKEREPLSDRCRSRTWHSRHVPISRQITEGAVRNCYGLVTCKSDVLVSWPSHSGLGLARASYAAFVRVLNLEYLSYLILRILQSILDTAWQR